VAATQAPERFTGRVGVAHGSVTGLCSGLVSLVPPLAGTVPALPTDTTAYRLERQRPLHLCRLASARDRSSVARSRVDHDVGVRTCGDSRRFHLASKVCATCDADRGRGLGGLPIRS
jgi:hypothetical protein